MSVETEIENLRDDVRSMRAAFDSFSKTFNADVMSRLATFEQWKVSQEINCTKTEVKVEALQHEIQHVAHVPGLVTLTATLKAQNDRQEGSISTLKVLGSLIGVVLAIASIINIVLSVRGH